VANAIGWIAGKRATISAIAMNGGRFGIGRGRTGSTGSPPSR
jgi:hypothetical protein